jgi:ABC-type glycerol-3-phosphate transport system substrate-binding protein
MQFIIGALLAVVTLAACGSGSSVTLPQQKKATLVFAASTSASLPTAVRDISISARIPAGVTVPLEPGSKTQVANTVLVALKAGSIIGNYSAPVLRIQAFADPTSASGLGLDNVRQFAGIILPVQDSITESSFTALNPSFPEFKATGQTPGNTVDLSTYLKPSMKVTF